MTWPCLSFYLISNPGMLTGLGLEVTFELPLSSPVLSPSPWASSQLTAETFVTLDSGLHLRPGPLCSGSPTCSDPSLHSHCHENDRETTKRLHFVSGTTSAQGQKFPEVVLGNWLNASYSPAPITPQDGCPFLKLCLTGNSGYLDYTYSSASIRLFFS